MQKKTHHLFTLLIVLCSSNLLIGQVIFEDDFESGTFKPQWTVSPGDNDGLISVIESNSISYEGFYGVAIGKESDGEFNLNTLDLNLDLSSYQ